MTSFRDVRCIFPIYPHTMTSSDQSADVSTNMTSYQMLCIFLRVLTLLYYHTKPQFPYLISVGFKQGGQFCPPPMVNRLDLSPWWIGLKRLLWSDVKQNNKIISSYVQKIVLQWFKNSEIRLKIPKSGKWPPLQLGTGEYPKVGCYTFGLLIVYHRHTNNTTMTPEGKWWGWRSKVSQRNWGYGENFI